MRCSFNGICKTNTIAVILFLAAGFLFAGCDKGKKPYEEAEALFNKSDYAAAKIKASEVVQNAPNSKYLSQARVILENVEKIESISKAAAASIEEGDYEKGIAAYSEVLTLAPHDKIVVASKEKAEKVLNEVEFATKMGETERKAILNSLKIKFLKGEEKLMEDERGGSSCFPTIDFQIMNNTPYPIKIYSAIVKYSYYSEYYYYGRNYQNEPLAKDSITLNNIVKKDGVSKVFTSLSKFGLNSCRTKGPHAYLGGWGDIIGVELTLQTSIGQIFKKGAIAQPGSPYIDKGIRKHVDKSGVSQY